MSSAQGTWTKKAPFPASSRNYGLGFSVGNKGYYGMGQKQTKPFVYKTYNDFWEYDLETNSWTQKSDFPGAGRLRAKGFSVNNKIFVGFGYLISASGANAGSNEYQTDLYAFDPGTNNWIKKNSAYLGRGDIFFSLKDILYSANPEFRTLNKYNAVTDTWFERKWEKNSVAPNHSNLTGENIGFSSGDKVYIIASAWKKNKCANQLWELDPNTVTWKQKNDLPLPGNDTIIVFGAGEKSYVIRGGNEVLAYSPETDAWTAKKEIPSEHKDFYPAFSIGERNYGFSKFEFWEFVP
ncbi:MAG: hypothetical protein EPN85_01120 [Bacteroidetes bacterium]|nr:MAG: hypothetical protein EPN85_01120 [Bacteroidota bacterium]